MRSDRSVAAASALKFSIQNPFADLREASALLLQRAGHLLDPPVVLDVQRNFRLQRQDQVTMGQRRLVSRWNLEHLG